MLEIKTLSINKLRQLLVELQIGGVGVKDLYLIRSIEDEIARRSK